MTWTKQRGVEPPNMGACVAFYWIDVYYYQG